MTWIYWDQTKNSIVLIHHTRHTEEDKKTLLYLGQYKGEDKLTERKLRHILTETELGREIVYKATRLGPGPLHQALLNIESDVNNLEKWVNSNDIL